MDYSTSYVMLVLQTFSSFCRWTTNLSTFLSNPLNSLHLKVTISQDPRSKFDLSLIYINAALNLLSKQQQLFQIFNNWKKIGQKFRRLVSNRAVFSEEKQSGSFLTDINPVFVMLTARVKILFLRTVWIWEMFSSHVQSSSNWTNLDGNKIPHNSACGLGGFNLPSKGSF